MSRRRPARRPRSASSCSRWSAPAVLAGQRVTRPGSPGRVRRRGPRREPRSTAPAARSRPASSALALVGRRPRRWRRADRQAALLRRVTLRRSRWPAVADAGLAVAGPGGPAGALGARGGSLRRTHRLGRAHAGATAWPWLAMVAPGCSCVAAAVGGWRGRPALARARRALRGPPAAARVPRPAGRQRLGPPGRGRRPRRAGTPARRAEQDSTVDCAGLRPTRSTPSEWARARQPATQTTPTTAPQRQEPANHGRAEIHEDHGHSVAAWTGVGIMLVAVRRWRSLACRRHRAIVPLRGSASRSASSARSRARSSAVGGLRRQRHRRPRTYPTATARGRRQYAGRLVRRRQPGRCPPLPRHRAEPGTGRPH